MAQELVNHMRQYQEYPESSAEWHLQNLTKAIEGKYCRIYCARKDNELAGYATVYNTKNKGEQYIEDIFVKEEYRGKGIGKAIIQKILQDFKGKKLAISTSVKNKSAIEFYKKSGFKEYRITLALEN